MERPAHWGREKKNCSGSSAIISYQPIQTTSPTARSVRVCLCPCVFGSKQRERQRERESKSKRQNREGGGSIFFHLTPPSSLVKLQEGGARPLAANQIRSWQPALSQQQTIDRLHVKEFSAWLKEPFFFHLVTFLLYFPPPPTNIWMTF